LLQARGLSRHFQQGSARIDVLRDLSLEVLAGERVAIVGSSGSGKSTLLQLLGGLDTPDQGEVWIGGQNLAALGENERGALRNRGVGFVYQFHHLLPEFSALENVALPLLVRRVPASEARTQAGQMLARVGLHERLGHRPSELSGGERQRAAVARALVTRPQLVLADEPTGNLDGDNADAVFELLLDLNREAGTALVVVTHDLARAARMDRVLKLDHGRLLPLDVAR
jgi:lipoprotein-releasing system ATP-binding protein